MKSTFLKSKTQRQKVTCVISCLFFICIGVYACLKPTQVDAKEPRDEDPFFPLPLIGQVENQLPDESPVLTISAPSWIKGRLFYAREPVMKAEYKAMGGNLADEDDPARQGRNSRAYFLLQSASPNANTLRSYPVELNGGQKPMRASFLPSGEKVLVRLGWPYGRYGDFGLFLIEVSTGALQRVGHVRLIYENVQVSSDGNFYAYLEGVDRLGLPLGHNHKVELKIFDLRMDKEHIVASGDELPKSNWVWTRQNKLLFSKVEMDTKTKLERPNLYEADGQGGEPKLLLHDAWRALPSPDGEWLAFFGAEKPQAPEPLSSNWLENPSGASICIARSDGTERRAINREQISYPLLLWRHDSQHLLSIKSENGTQSNWGVIQEYDVKANSVRKLAALRAADATPSPRWLSVDPYFSSPQLSADGNVLFAQVHFYGPRKGATYENHDQLMAANLETGEVWQICHLVDGWALAYHDEGSTPPPAPVTKPALPSANAPR